MSSPWSYQIPLTGIDSNRLLESWAWLIGRDNYRPLLMTLFGDWFLEDRNHSVHFLNLVSGEIERIDATFGDLEALLSTGRARDEWLMVDMVDLLRDQGMTLKVDQCFSYKLPPVIGGRIEPANIEPFNITAWQSICSQIHEKTRNLPPGTKITGFTVDGTKP